MSHSCFATMKVKGDVVSDVINVVVMSCLTDLEQQSSRHIAVYTAIGMQRNKPMSHMSDEAQLLDRQTIAVVHQAAHIPDVVKSGSNRNARALVLFTTAFLLGVQPTQSQQQQTLLCCMIDCSLVQLVSTCQGVAKYKCLCSIEDNKTVLHRLDSGVACVCAGKRGASAQGGASGGLLCDHFPQCLPLWLQHRLQLCRGCQLWPA